MTQASQTSTAEQLLVVALQDLFDAERAWGERLMELGDKLPETLTGYADAERVRSSAQAARLETALEGFDAGEPMPNIWLRAILGDAARDASTIAAGPLRAIALVGAFRKGKQSERVSYETAIGLAERLGREDIAVALQQSRDEESQADEALARLLATLLQSIE